MKKFLVRKKSRIHGFGIFSMKEIKKGKIFYIVPTNKISKKPKRRWAHIRNNNWVYDNKILNWINHSCNANTKLDISKEKPMLVAKRKIKEGEEITCNYDVTEKGGKKLSCKCKSKNCKGHFSRIE